MFSTLNPVQAQDASNTALEYDVAVSPEPWLPTDQAALYAAHVINVGGVPGVLTVEQAEGVLIMARLTGSDALLAAN